MENTVQNKINNTFLSVCILSKRKIVSTKCSKNLTQFLPAKFHHMSSCLL